MQTLLDSFTKLQKIRALVVGDLMLDIYVKGEVERISPEAPVPILKVNSQEMRAGGAGNVIMNLLALDADVTALGRIGDDIEGSQIQEILQKNAVDISYIYREDGYITPTKSRLIGNSQQLYRIDKEINCPIRIDIEEKILNVIPSMMSCIDIILVSDYKKGIISPRILEAIFALSKEYDIPVIVDPKGDDFGQYKGAYLIKPNLKEAYLAARISPQSSLDEVAQILIQQSNVKYLLITRSEKGISLFEKDKQKRRDFSVCSREVKDVTGAGDSVLAMLAVSIANHVAIDNAIQLANISGALAIERLGCVSISLSDIAEYILRHHQTEQRNKLAHGIPNKLQWNSEKDLEVIKKSLSGYQLIVIDSSERLASFSFERFLPLKEKNEDKILVYMQGEQKDFDYLPGVYFLLYELGFIVIGGNASLDKLREIFGGENIYLFNSKEIEKELICQ